MLCIQISLCAFVSANENWFSEVLTMRNALVAIAVAVMSTASFGFSHALPFWVNGTGVWQEADVATLVSPATITMNAGDTTPSILGELYDSGVTEPTGPGTGVVAQLGYGAYGSDPRYAVWTWLPVTYYSQLGTADEYTGSFSINTAGTYAYTYRFALDDGGTWTAADLAGDGSNPAVAFLPNDIGMLTINQLPVPEPASAGLVASSALILLRSRRRA
jgi:hypothetical protein